jgi:predicted lipid-binding transport protein (Tim44 family)
VGKSPLNQLFDEVNMDLFEIIGLLLDWSLFWRFNLSLIFGTGIGIMCMLNMTDGVFRWVALVFWIIVGLIIGSVWQSKSRWMKNRNNQIPPRQFRTDISRGKMENRSKRHR